MNKKVIFVAGTSYSGSTLLDLILSNDDNALSVGEIESIFHPVKMHHMLKIDELKHDPVWSGILAKGVSHLYENIHDIFNVNTIIDSSKNPAWIRYHIDRLPENVCYSVILVHKSLFDLKHSFEKRGRYNWIRVYKNYHSLFFKHIKDFHAIEYKEIPTNSDKFWSLLKSIGIEKDEHRLNFWEKKRTNFFGNNNANRAFGNNESEKRLRYIPQNSQEALSKIQLALQSDVKLNAIHTYLSCNDPGQEAPQFNGLLMNYRFRLAVKQIRVLINKVRYFRR